MRSNHTTLDGTKLRTSRFLTVRSTLLKAGAQCIEFVDTDKRVSEKTYKEHRRLFFNDHQWVKDGPFSRSSSPLCVSDPPDSMSGASQPQHELDEAVDVSDEDNSSFPAFEGLTSYPEKGSVSDMFT